VEYWNVGIVECWFLERKIIYILITVSSKNPKKPTCHLPPLAGGIEGRGII
jgi:hypothetical protein